MSPSWLPTSEELGVVALSLRVAVVAMALMLVPGIACAWLLARRNFPGKSLADTIVHLPLVLPPVVVGYLLLVLLGRRGILGEPLHLDIAFTWKAAAIAAAVMGFPLLVRSVRLAIEAVDTRLEQAAGTLGAGPWRVFATVTLPLALPGVLAGALLAFARCLGEFGATITFAGNIPGLTRTIPTAIYTATQSPGGDMAAARLAVISIVLAVVAVAGGELLARRMRRTLGNGAC